MKIHDHIRNKIGEASDDERFSLNVEEVIRMLNAINIDYAVLGSCGIQTYLDYFFRLPNDLDVVTEYAFLPKIRELCSDKNYQFIEQLGRVKMTINELAVHIIPEKLNSIEKVSNQIFTQINLKPYMKLGQLRDIRLLGALTHPKIFVFPLEVNLFVEFIRPIYTGSLMNVFYSTRYLDIDIALLKKIFTENPDLNKIVLTRLNEYSKKIKEMTYLKHSDIEESVRRIVSLRNVLLNSNTY